MTGEHRKERKALNRLADILAEDILNTPDEDILAEFKSSQGDPAKNAATMQALFQKTAISMNKQRLAAARTAVDADRRARGGLASPAVADIAEARRVLRRVLEVPASGHPVTLAARKETELSDADVLSLLENLRELGIVSPDDKEDP